MDSVIIILLSFATLVIAVSSVALLRLSSPLDQLHYISLAVTLALPAVGLAVLIDRGFSISSLKSILLVLFVFVTSPVLTTATARAVRIREYGGWRLSAEEDKQEKQA